MHFLDRGSDVLKVRLFGRQPLEHIGFGAPGCAWKCPKHGVNTISREFSRQTRPFPPKTRAEDGHGRRGLAEPNRISAQRSQRRRTSRRSRPSGCGQFHPPPALPVVIFWVTLNSNPWMIGHMSVASFYPLVRQHSTVRDSTQKQHPSNIDV